MMIRGGGNPYTAMAAMPLGEWTRRLGALPAEAYDCFMVGTLYGSLLAVFRQDFHRLRHSGRLGFYTFRHDLFSRCGLRHRLASEPRLIGRACVPFDLLQRGVPADGG